MIIPTQDQKVFRKTQSDLERILAEIPNRGYAMLSGGDVERCEIRYQCKAQRIAELVEGMDLDSEIDTSTEHAWLVVLGYFARSLGLIAGLEAVSIDQRQGPKHSPQSKLIEFLIGVLGGIEYLQDLNREAQPIAGDEALAKAWAQAIFAHYSGVSRTLDAADEGTLDEVIEVLREVSKPFIQEAVMETIRKTGRLVVDVDLTGRPVSPTSSDFPEADFGWMADAIQKGYQAAVSSLVCERWDRLLLDLERYPGRTSSAECLQAAVEEVEQVLQLRPRCRVELLDEQRRQLQDEIGKVQEQLDRNQHQQTNQLHQVREARGEQQTFAEKIGNLEAEYQAKERIEKPHSYLAKARHQLTAAQKREQRAWRNLQKIQTKRTRYSQTMQDLQAQLVTLEERLSYLEADNLSNPNPIPVVLRVDAGFSTDINLKWLIEMGYTVLTKAHHGQITNCLRTRLSADTIWSRVGKNAEAASLGDYFQHDCPYPFQTLLVRYHLPEKMLYSTLFDYGDTPPPGLAQWFHQYNERQTIEAGIKQCKGVFTLKRHLVRSPFGMQLQEQFALFAANFVRWASAWVKDALRQANRSFTAALDQIKTLSRIISRSRARWVCNHHGNTLIFDEHGPFSGTVLSLSGQVAVQLPLLLFNFFSP
ncbi:MAG: hypothetical protein MUO62_09905 [Anaerolineales bacterium]|nr:hypothetical protein [Anaerolineales bacterium]